VADTKKTHVEIKEPTISVRYLADYMAGSERKKRTIAEGCKYRPLARILQHQEAQAVVTGSFLNGIDTAELKARSNAIRNKLADDDFDALTNEANADYVKQFAAVADGVNLPVANIEPGNNFPPVHINGVKVSFRPHLSLSRPNPKTNKLMRGAMMLRYAKGKALPSEIADYQSAAIFGLIGMLSDKVEAEVEKGLCLTFDAYSGNLYRAPGASLTRWTNMMAACESIAERWPNIKPPKNAVL
jgi:hypothetical protein